MDESILNAKGQLTVPAALRRVLGAKPGARFLWGLMPDGNVMLIPRNKSLSDIAGMLVPMDGIHVSIEDMAV